MICPWCGKEMEAGNLNAYGRVTWTAEAAGGWQPLGYRPGDVRLIGRMTTPPLVPAWNCPDCKKIIVEYPKSK